MLPLYNAALLPLRPAVELWSAWQSRDPERRTEWAERRARALPVLNPGGVWLHGASVGEAGIVTGLARAIRARHGNLPLAVSAYTTTGRARLPAPPEIDAAFFVPLDFPACVRRVLQAVQPSLFALVETELWPNLMHEAQAAGVPIVVLNGRLSVRSMNRYRRLSRLLRPPLERLARVGAQSQADAARFAELGVPASVIEVTGNIKYDLSIPVGDGERWRRLLRLSPDRPVVVAGSTAAGEESLILDAVDIARRAHPELLLILAPRYPLRADDVAAQVQGRGWSMRRLSAGRDRDVSGLEVLLVDTVGDLAALYGVASVAFVGGTLVPRGGHNVLEPAAHGVPVLYGPHTESVTEPSETLERAGGALRVADSQELGRAISGLLEDEAERTGMGRRGRQVLEDNRGALERSMSVLQSVLDRRGVPAALSIP